MSKHTNTLKRIALVAELTNKYYEPERLDRCYKAIWRRYINPIYPMDYRTYLRYLHTNYKKELKKNL